MSPPRASQSFDRIAETYDETRGGLRVGRTFADAVAARIAPPPATIMEIGVGTGLVALPLTELGYTVLGVDVSSKMLAVAHERIGARVAIGDASRAPIASASCDAVVAARVLHVVADPGALLADAARMVNATGRVVVILAGSARIDERNDMGEATRDLYGGRLRGPDPDTVVSLATGTGALDLVELGSTPPVEYEETPRAFADMIRNRAWSGFWEINDDVWARTSAAAIERLLALPEPDRPRQRQRSQHLLVFSRR